MYEFFCVEGMSIGFCVEGMSIGFCVEGMSIWQLCKPLRLQQDPHKQQLCCPAATQTPCDPHIMKPI